MYVKKEKLVNMYRCKIDGFSILVFITLMFEIMIYRLLNFIS